MPSDPDAPNHARSDDRPDDAPKAGQSPSTPPQSQPTDTAQQSTDLWHAGEESLGGMIRLLRKRTGRSLSDLATSVGCAKSYLSAIETNKRQGPARDLLERLETQLGTETGTLVRLAERGRASEALRDELRTARAQSAMLARLRAVVGDTGLDEAHRAGAIRRMLAELGGSPLHTVDHPDQDTDQDTDQTHSHTPGHTPPVPNDLPAGVAPLPALPLEVPLINKVAAGYPAEFTDLGYPARVADDYVRCPDIRDPDAFAARVVGDSMSPDYREGDIVVFSPLRDIADGDDCFARLATGDESTFKRVYFEADAGSERIRLQPINSRYAPRTYDREDVAGLYRAVQVMRAL